MKISKSFLFLLSVILFSACAKKDDNKIDFTFLQLNDVYEIAPIHHGI